MEIWPKPHLSFKRSWNSQKIRVETVEEYFQQLYPNAYPVLMPSGRAAIHVILQYVGCSRLDLVKVPPLSSHCVINSVGFLSNPTQQTSSFVRAEILHHQWGFMTKPTTSSSIIIEDSIDSLIPPNGNIFPNDGRFEIMSISKIFGSLVGGVILCQSRKDAETLRNYREQINCQNLLHFMLRVLGTRFAPFYEHWALTEPKNRWIPRIAIFDIWEKITEIEHIIEDRKDKIQWLRRQKTPLARKLPTNRYPSCWPVPWQKLKNTKTNHSQMMRRIPRTEQDIKLKCVFPIPLHFKVRTSELEKFCSQ